MDYKLGLDHSKARSSNRTNAGRSCSSSSKNSESNSGRALFAFVNKRTNQNSRFVVFAQLQCYHQVFNSLRYVSIIGRNRALTRQNRYCACVGIVLKNFQKRIRTRLFVVGDLRKKT